MGPILHSGSHHISLLTGCEGVHGQFTLMLVFRGGEDFADTVNGLRLPSHYTVDDQRRKGFQINLNQQSMV